MNIHPSKLWRRAPLLGALVLASCNLDAAVFVDAEIEDPALAISKASPLVTSMSGSFQLTLHLSARASGPSKVTVQKFSLESEDGKTEYISELDTVQDKANPIDVAEDSTVTVDVTVSTGVDTIPADVVTQVCSGKVVIKGIIQDSLATGLTPFESDPFTVSGC